MSADPFSSLGSFDCKKGDFEYYTERFELCYAGSNEKDDEIVKAGKFISVIGEEAFHKLKELCKEVEPRTKPFKELKEKLSMHFSRRDFYNRNQYPHESKDDYKKEIKRLATKCFFGPFINTIIADRVAGGAYLPVSMDNSESSMVETSVGNQPNRLESTNSNTGSLEMRHQQSRTNTGRSMWRGRNNNTGNLEMRNQPNRTNSGRSMRRNRRRRNWNDNYQ